MSKKKQPQKHRSEHAVHFVGASRDSGQAENHEREDFLSDLKKASTVYLRPVWNLLEAPVFLCLKDSRPSNGIDLLLRDVDLDRWPHLSDLRQSAN